jgi:hypothetical protein
MGKTPGEMQVAIVANLTQRTGKTVEEWARVLPTAGYRSGQDRVSLQMAEHELGRVAANLVAQRAEGSGTDYSDSDAVLADMFSGSMAAQDLGLVLPGVKPGARLLPVWGTNYQDRIRMRIPVMLLEDIDAELECWLKSAYELDAE